MNLTKRIRVGLILGGLAAVLLLSGAQAYSTPRVDSAHGCIVDWWPDDIQDGRAVLLTVETRFETLYVAEWWDSSQMDIGRSGWAYKHVSLWDEWVPDTPTLYCTGPW